MKNVGKTVRTGCQNKKKIYKVVDKRLKKQFGKHNEVDGNRE
jgi:hypothetical protein